MKNRRARVSCQDCGEPFETVHFGGLTRRYCDDCAQKNALLEEERIRAQEAARIEAQYREMVAVAGIPKKWHGESFATSDPTRNRRAFRIAQDYARDFSLEAPALVFYSSGYGCGKTHLAACIANYVLDELRRPVLFKKAPDLLLEIRRTFSNPDTSEADVLEQVLAVDLLVLDDVGLNTPSSWVESTYWTIFDRRLEWALPMVVTTNYAIDAEPGEESLGDRIGFGALSRLLHMCNGQFIDMSGPDLR